ncbi:DUF4190 domain-containing protein [Cellulomonas persica]|uniref:DUF4190 domain-containing protein n=1 Tax=Cellulomonas persica TaxID=76861 RepID=A0A510UXB7_9CELL|nr:DUF4190 domain-containing protein [Cellulomonas persica]GEK19209.1 hypothetical protein CPE01_29420 [Cellulomonas persica]
MSTPDQPSDPLQPSDPASSSPYAPPPADASAPGAPANGQAAASVPAYGGPPAHDRPPAYGQPAAYGQAPYGQPPYGQAPAYGYAADLPKNGLAVWSLVLGIASLVLCGLFSGIPAIVVGNKAKRAAAAGEANNESLATGGIITGWIGTVLSGLGVLIVLVATLSVWQTS